MPDGSFQLVRYDAACRAVAEARSIDEARDLRDKAEAMRAYGRQAKNKQLEVDAAEIRFRAERRLGEMMVAQRETVGLATGAKGNPGGQGAKVVRVDDGPAQIPTLAEAGIDKHLADRARKMAAVPAPEFEAKISNFRQRVEQEGERVTVDLLASGERHIRGTFGTGDNEWFTPARYIDAAREVMGAIDLDPATHLVAQETVQAERFFTEADNGLSQSWGGRVWLNPPYAQPLIGQFVSKLVGELRLGAVSEAILLTHNYTDTEWFHAAEAACNLICFTRGRIRFVDPDGNECSPTQGQAFFYFGPNDEQFRSVFSAFGFVR